MKKKWQVTVKLKNGGQYDPMTVKAETLGHCIAKVKKDMGQEYWEKYVSGAEAHPFDPELDEDTPMEIEEDGNL